LNHGCDFEILAVSIYVDPRNAPFGAAQKLKFHMLLDPLQKIAEA
jgi:hypothetical protein